MRPNRDTQGCRLVRVDPSTCSDWVLNRDAFQLIGVTCPFPNDAPDVEHHRGVCAPCSTLALDGKERGNSGATDSKADGHSRQPARRCGGCALQHAGKDALVRLGTQLDPMVFTPSPFERGCAVHAHLPARLFGVASLILAARRSLSLEQLASVLLRCITTTPSRTARERSADDSPPCPAKSRACRRFLRAYVRPDRATVRPRRSAWGFCRAHDARRRKARKAADPRSAAAGPLGP